VKPNQHFPGLDGLRGVAALVVVFLHGTLTFDIGYVPGAACLAVDFFFLLSGFVIAHAYDERPGRSSLTWRQFMAVRMVRLYPMLFPGTATGLLVTVLSQAHKHELHPVLGGRPAVPRRSASQGPEHSGRRHRPHAGVAALGAGRRSGL